MKDEINLEKQGLDEVGAEAEAKWQNLLIEHHFCHAPTPARAKIGGITWYWDSFT